MSGISLVVTLLLYHHSLIGNNIAMHYIYLLLWSLRLQVQLVF